MGFLLDAVDAHRERLRRHFFLFPLWGFHFHFLLSQMAHFHFLSVLPHLLVYVFHFLQISLLLSHIFLCSQLWYFTNSKLNHMFQPPSPISIVWKWRFDPLFVLPSLPLLLVLAWLACLQKQTRARCTGFMTRVSHLHFWKRQFRTQEQKIQKRQKLQKNRWCYKSKQKPTVLSLWPQPDLCLYHTLLKMST